MTQAANQFSYVRAFVEGMVRGGVTEAVICPGSRSTPLTLALAEDRAIRIWMAVDERSAAFFALGMAKASGKAVALVSSSGTAAANFYPAIVEAALAGVGLVVLTADRPHELREVGAAQSIDQVKIYGPYVKQFVDMAPIDQNTDLRDYARAWGRRCSEMALSEPSGPIHCNFPLREPLLADGMEHAVTTAIEGPSTFIGTRRLDAWQRHHIATMLAQRPQGLIVVGPETNPAWREKLLAFARHFCYPIFADPLSQLRSGHQDRQVVTGYDGFLRRPAARQWLRPELVIRFGPIAVSKWLNVALGEWSDVPQLLVDPGLQWKDPHHQRDLHVLAADAMSLCDDLMANTPPRQETETTRAWMGRFTRLDHLSRQVLCETLSEPSATADQARVAVAVTGQAGVAETEKDSGGDLFEGEVPITLAEVLPEGSTVYVGNSMPVRDFDSFWPGSPQAVTFLGNRGANGIDGVVSSALGASTQRAPLVLVIGDLSFYHDMNGLLAAKLHRLSATIIVVNNQGGAIFSFLPQAQFERFEELFAVPLGLDYALAVEMYGGRFFRVRTRSALREAVTTSLAAPGLKVIEVISDRGKNYRRHQQLWDQLNARVDQFLIDAGQGQA